MRSSWGPPKPGRCLLWTAGLLAAGLLLVVLVMSAGSTGDYAAGAQTAGDNAAPGVGALLHGDLAGYVAHQPAIGLTSILIRLPLAGLARLAGGGPLITYQLGALAVVLPLAVFAGWLAAGRATRRETRLAGALAGLLLLASPVLREAVLSGHPEDALAGVLATVSVIAATRGQARWAGALLGLAVGAKPWALIALPSVMIGLPHRRLEAAAVAGAVAFLLCAVAPLADPGAFARALHGEGATNLINPFSAWWPVSTAFHLPSGELAPARLLPLGLSRAQSSLATLTVALAALAAGYEKARRRGASWDPLALLALLAVVRCLCDSTHLEYYYLSILIPLAAWEVVAIDRFPWLTGLATAAIALIPNLSRLNQPTVVWTASMAATVVLAVYLARHAMQPDPAAVRQTSVTFVQAT